MGMLPRRADAVVQHIGVSVSHAASAPSLSSVPCHSCSRHLDVSKKGSAQTLQVEEAD